VQAQKKEKTNYLKHPELFYAKYFPWLKFNTTQADSQYVASYPDYLTVGMNTLIYNVDLKLTPTTTLPHPGKDITSQFNSISKTNIGFNFGYRSLSGGFTFNVAPTNTADYAPSSYHTFDLKLTNPKYIISFNHYKVKGYTDVNRDNNIGGTGKYVKRPDLQVLNDQLSAIYNFHWKRYSYASSFSFSERQVRSHWGLMAKVGLAYTNISADSALVSAQQKKYYGEFANVSQMKGVSVKLASGIGGNLVLFRHFYLSSVLFPGCDIFFYHYVDEHDNKSHSSQSAVLIIDASLSVGFQSERFFIGLREILDNRASRLSSVKMDATSFYTVLELGYRFNSPKPLKKIYRKVMPPGM
jgi:hypothetical protein